MKARQSLAICPSISCLAIRTRLVANAVRHTGIRVPWIPPYDQSVHVSVFHAYCDDHREAITKGLIIGLKRLDVIRMLDSKGWKASLHLVMNELIYGNWDAGAVLVEPWFKKCQQAQSSEFSEFAFTVLRPFIPRNGADFERWQSLLRTEQS